MIQVKKSLIIFSFLLSVVTLAAGQPSLPQQFEGTVEVNGDQASEGRTIYAQVGDGELKEASVGSSGEYRIALSGEDGSAVSFFTENATGGMIEASTSPENPVFEEGGDSKTVDLDFSIKKPEPRVITGDVEDKGEDFAVLPVRTRFVESDRHLYFEYSDASRSYESESVEVKSGEHEIRIEDLDYDTEYSYTAYLDGEDQINGSTKEFETDNRPPFTVDGQTNLESGYVEAWIDGENIRNESLDSSGDFRFEIDYTYSRNNEYVDIRLRDEEKTLEFVSGGTSEVEFEFDDFSSSETVQDQNSDSEKADESTESDSGKREENQTDEENTTSSTDSPAQEEKESEDDTEGQGDEVRDEENTSIADSPEENTDGSNSLVTGRFFQEQTNSVTILLLLGIMILAVYIGRNSIYRFDVFN